MDVWRRMLAAVNANSRTVDGRTKYPQMYGDDGWYAYQDSPYSQGALDVYYWSMDPDDLKYVPENAWLKFLDGENEGFAEAALRREFASIREKANGMRRDTSTPDTRMSDDTLRYNPAINSCLTQLMLGGLTPRYGEALHCRLRYFDPVRQRAGIPEDVAALVEGMTDETVTVSLVNVNPVDHRTVIVQAGAYGEHQVTAVQTDGITHSVDCPFFTVRLAPGSGSRLVVTAKRYVNQPTFVFPWDRE